jgi:hypothetical protein
MTRDMPVRRIAIGVAAADSTSATQNEQLVAIVMTRAACK